VQQISAAPGSAMRRAAAAGFAMSSPEAFRTRFGGRSPEEYAAHRAEREAMIEKARDAPDEFEATLANPERVVVGSAWIGDLEREKIFYDYVDQFVSVQKERIVQLESQLENAVDSTQTSDIKSKIDYANRRILYHQIKAKQFPEFVRLFQQKVAQVYSVSGNFLTQNEDGKFEWGIFAVRHATTGALGYSHNGDGKLVEIDPYIEAGERYDDLR
jgi:hypothetical protein